MSLFVFFTTTMSVSFTLRETQARMLKFTGNALPCDVTVVIHILRVINFVQIHAVQLQYHARHRLPTFRLIFIHVIESLVFVPVSFPFSVVFSKRWCTSIIVKSM